MEQQRQSNNAPISSGVETLIERLRDEGVERGRSEAQRLIAEAHQKANIIIDQAQQDADEILKRAQQETEHLRISGQEALDVAARDTLLTLKSQLSNHFAREVERLVSKELHSEELLRDLVRAVVMRATERIDPDERMEILLPRDVVGLEELRRKPDELSQGELTRFVQALSEEITSRGISFGQMEDSGVGLRLRLVDKSMTIDLTDQAVASLLLEHLQPRFRALLEGIVK